MHCTVIHPDGFAHPPCPQSNFTITMQGSQNLVISLHWQVCPMRLFLGHSIESDP